MSSAISTLELLNKAMRFVSSNAGDEVVKELVKDAIIQANRDLYSCDYYPLDWNIYLCDLLPRTVPHAEISAITQADPGVITAESSDAEITGHGFHDNASAGVQDIVVIDDVADDGSAGTHSIEELNGRAYLLEYASTTTFSLKTIDGLDAVSASGLSAYDEGGVVYHAGYLLDASATGPILANVSAKWTFGRILDNPPPTFDGFPTSLISSFQVSSPIVNGSWGDISLASRPTRTRYWQNWTESSTVYHYLFWYPVVNDYHNVAFHYEKNVADISKFDSSTYPFHPPDLHDTIWHGALANLAGLVDKVKRSNDKVIATQVEVLFAQKWAREWERGKIKARNLSRRNRGGMGSTGGFYG
uniref:Putative tail protein n=1 Tax=viral metagenome TaxID=1070528 RepID=A0A6M3KFT2_9ZZZZ